jgi:hypothetical protein
LPVAPGFQYDLFVSYAHRNDAAWREGGAGWVTEFVRTLKAELEAKSRDFRIWFDPQLRTGDDFNLAIGAAIAESAVFLAVLSPAYDDCPYCRKEVVQFREQRNPSFGMRAGTLSRMQALVLDELAEERWPPELRTTSPYRFYEGSVRYGKPSEPDEKHPYVQGLFKVRDSIWAVIEEMRLQKQRGTAIEHSYDMQASSQDGAAAVYLADVPDDLYYKRESLRSSLGQLNEFEVLDLGEGAPPAGPAILSVHLFSKFPSRPAPGKSLPLPRLQLEAALAANPARRPLVWMARDLEPKDAETDSHREFLQSLLNHTGIELLRTGFEDLKDEIQKRVRPKTSPLVKTVRRTREDPIVHIWHQTAQSAPIVPLKQVLKDNNCGISVFPYESMPPEKLQSKLAFCDGLVVPYTTESKSWAEDVMTEAFQLRRREERPLAFAAVELPPGANGEFNFEHARVVPVRGTATGQFQGIDQFLAKLEEEDV